MTFFNMGEGKIGLNGQISPDAHFGSFHFCGYCPWAMFYHWGCVTNGSANLVNKKDTVSLRKIHKLVYPKSSKKKENIEMKNPLLKIFSLLQGFFSKSFSRNK